MVAAAESIARRLSGEARAVYEGLDFTLRNEPHRIPELSELTVVVDPENVLSKEEMDVINTGIGDQQMRASYKLMSWPLRYALDRGIDVCFENEKKAREYISEQREWMGKCKWFLQARLGRAPYPEELVRDYCTDGAIFFKIRRLFLQPEMVIKVRRPLYIPRSDMGILNAFVKIEPVSAESSETYAAA